MKYAKNGQDLTARGIAMDLQKGPTSLKSYLNLHPQIYMHEREIHFFDRKLSSGDLIDEDIDAYDV